MARLNYHHLYYFWRVANEGNLTRVAKHLHVSQSALSSQIRALEDSAGVNLFDRVGRSLTLTDAGRRVLEYANDIFARGEELEAWFHQGAGAENQPLRIGMISTLSRNFIDRLIMPQIGDGQLRVTLEARTLEGLLHGLSSHQLDVALTNGDVRGGDEQLWQSQLLARQPISILGPPQADPATAFPNGYEDAKWVLPTRDSEIRRGFEALCARRNYEPNIIAEANDMPILRLLARDTGAYSVLPRVVVQDEVRRGILAEYETLPDITENFYAITIKRRHTPSALRTLLDGFAASDWPDLMPPLAVKAS